MTHDDIYDWVAAMSPVHLNERSYANYVRSYDVASKVRTAKLRGDFERLTARRRPPFHARLALMAIL